MSVDRAGVPAADGSADGTGPDPDVGAGSPTRRDRRGVIVPLGLFAIIMAVLAALFLREHAFGLPSAMVTGVFVTVVLVLGVVALALRHPGTRVLGVVAGLALAAPIAALPATWDALAFTAASAVHPDAGPAGLVAIESTGRTDAPVVVRGEGDVDTVIDLTPLAGSAAVASVRVEPATWPVDPRWGVDTYTLVLGRVGSTADDAPTSFAVYADSRQQQVMDEVPAALGLHVSGRTTWTLTITPVAALPILSDGTIDGTGQAAFVLPTGTATVGTDSAVDCRAWTPGTSSTAGYGTCAVHDVVLGTGGIVLVDPDDDDQLPWTLQVAPS